MCNPAILPAIGGLLAPAAGAAGAASGASLAITAASAGLQAISAIGAANEQNRAAEQNRQSALDAYFLKTTQANLRVRQEATQAATQAQDNQLKTMGARSTALAAAAGAGVNGINVDQLMNDFTRSEGMINARTSQKLNDIKAQNQVNQLGYQSEAIGRIQSVKGASALETFANVVTPIASFGLDYYDTKARYAAIDD